MAPSGSELPDASKLIETLVKTLVEDSVKLGRGVWSFMVLIPEVVEVVPLLSITVTLTAKTPVREVPVDE